MKRIFWGVLLMTVFISEAFCSLEHFASLAFPCLSQDCLVLEKTESWFYNGRYEMEDAIEKADSSELIFKTDKAVIHLIGRDSNPRLSYVVFPFPGLLTWTDHTTFLSYSPIAKSLKSGSLAIPPALLVDGQGGRTLNPAYEYEELEVTGGLVFRFFSPVVEMRYQAQGSFLVQKDVMVNGILTIREFYKDFICIEEGKCIPSKVIRWTLEEYDRVTISEIVDYRLSDYSKYLTGEHFDSLVNQFEVHFWTGGGVL